MDRLAQTNSASAPPDFAGRLENAEIRASEACLAAVAEALPASGAVAETIAGGRAFYFGSLSPLSQAVGLGMNGAVADDEFERLEAFFLARNAPVAISLCPYAHPTLVEAIARRRYRITHFENTLVRAISAADHFLLPPRQLARRVESGEARLWARTVMEGFHDGSSVFEAPPEMEELFSYMQAAPGATAYLSCDEKGGAAAGGANLFVDRVAATALLAGDATLAAYRGQGRQTALIGARLHQAATEGCTLAIACTLPGSVSQRNYERAGFRVAYTKTLLVRDGLSA